jgi:hypothetical protein
VNPILETALEVQLFCRSRRWRFCFIGALAVQRWGEPRLTQDVDLTVLSGFGSEAEFVDALLSAYRGRIPDAREFALQRRVVLLEAASGVPVDVSLGGIPFEERVVERSSPWHIGASEPLMTCSAEDLVVLKAFAGRGSTRPVIAQGDPRSTRTRDDNAPADMTKAPEALRPPGPSTDRPQLAATGRGLSADRFARSSSALRGATAAAERPKSHRRGPRAGRSRRSRPRGTACSR